VRASRKSFGRQSSFRRFGFLGASGKQSGLHWSKSESTRRRSITDAAHHAHATRAGHPRRAAEILPQELLREPRSDYAGRLLLTGALVLCSVLSASAGVRLRCWVRLRSGSEGAIDHMGRRKCTVLHRPGRLESDSLSATSRHYVADVFTHWTTIPGVPIAATFAGHLDEDVSSANVVASRCTYSIPMIFSPLRFLPRSELFMTSMERLRRTARAGAAAPIFVFSQCVYGGPDNFKLRCAFDACARRSQRRLRWKHVATATFGTADPHVAACSA